MASRGINKVILVGNLGADPETRFMPSGGSVTNVRLATSESWKDKQTGQPQERTEWHRVVFFNRLGEVAGEYLRKGSKIYVEGSIRTRKWQDQSGQDRYTTEIVGNEMQMLDSRGAGTGGGASGGMGGGNFDQGGYDEGGYPESGQAPQAASQPMSRPQSQQQPQQHSQSQSQSQPQSQPQHQPQSQPSAMSDIDDDIPF